MSDQHPLTETAAAVLWNAHRTPNALPFHDQGDLYMRGQTAMLRAAFDAGREHERTNPEDDRPWEPLGESDQVCVGDEVRRDSIGVTATAVVARVAESGDPVTAEGGFIGSRRLGTWYVRRAVQELPTEDGAVIVPADGHEYIETQTGKKSRRLTWDAECLVWYDARGTHLRGDIIPGTWKVADQ